jgi:Tol biopolymer transport system component
VFLLSLPLRGADSADTFALPDSTLLFGWYQKLQVATPDHVAVITPPIDMPVNGGLLVFPGISPRGDAVAWGFAVPGVPEQDAGVREMRFVLGIYSLKTGRWQTYGAFGGIANPVFSPDGSKVVFYGGDRPIGSFFVFDLTNETITKLKNANPKEIRGIRSWSPGGKRLAVELVRKRKELVGIFDIGTSDLQIVGEGTQPTWSPDGKWIAYYNAEDHTTCLLVHPDGTGGKAIHKAGKGLFFGLQRWFGWGGPVWSPNSKHLLLTEINGPDGGQFVVLVDVADGTVQKKEKNVFPVYGWVGLPK